LSDKNAVKSLEKFANTLNLLDSAPEKPLNLQKAKEIEDRIASVFGAEEEEEDPGHIPVSPPIIEVFIGNTHGTNTRHLLLRLLHRNPRKTKNRKKLLKNRKLPKKVTVT
jgi:hypothetical protein